MSEPRGASYTVKELASRAGVTTRTIYYYVGEGLLPPPRGGGPASSYDDEHLLRLRLIRRLKEEYLPLAEIRRRLVGLDVEEARALLAAPAASPAPDSARAYLARVLGAAGEAGEPRAAEETPASPAPGDARRGPAQRPASPRPPPFAAPRFARPLPEPDVAGFDVAAPEVPDSDMASGGAPGPDVPDACLSDVGADTTVEAASPGRAWSDAAAEPESWQRIRISPDVELQVRATAPSFVRRRLARMVDALRRVLSP